MRGMAAAAAALFIGTAAATAPGAQTETASARCSALADHEEIREADRAAALAACTQASAARPDDARLLYLKGNALLWSYKDAEALAAYTAAADRGSAGALHQLGFMHRFGYGVTEDKAKALGFYQRALAAGHAPAALHIGRMHEWGEGMPKDPVAAVAMFRRAVDGGVASAGLPLGWHYENGRGVERDLALAVALYRAAAAAGEADAHANLGLMAEQGRGLPRDAAEAFRLYKLAAEGGSTEGMYSLGLAHQDGVGTPKSTAEAERWFRKGVEAGDKINSPNGLAYLLARENRNIEEAARLAEGALAAGPDDPAVQDTLALVRLRQKRLTEAALLARKAVARKPSQLHYARLGDVYAAMGLKDEARAAWRRALTAAADETEEPGAVLTEVRRKLAG